MKLNISEIVIEPAIQIRDQLDEATIERYVETFDSLPPMDVFRVAPGLLLADGFHRYEAARRLGRDEIEVKVHEGGWDDASAFAVTANASHGQPLSRSERDEGIARLHGLGWGAWRVAKALGIPEYTVSRVVEGQAAQREVGLPRYGAVQMPPSHYQEIARAPREAWQPIADLAAEKALKQHEIRQVVREARDVARQLNDPSITPEEKQQIVSTMLVRREDGEVGVPAVLVAAVLKDAKERTAGPAIYDFTTAAARLLGKLEIDPEPLANIGPDTFVGILRGLDDAELAIEKVRALIEAAR